MQHILIEKVKIWAALSHGCFSLQLYPKNTFDCSEANLSVAGHEDMERSYFEHFSEILDEDKVLLSQHSD